MKDNLLFCGFILLTFLGLAVGAPAWASIFTLIPLAFADASD